MNVLAVSALADFLLARIVEDQQTIRLVSNGHAIVGGVLAEASGDVLSVKRMLADCETKRRIVERATPKTSQSVQSDGTTLVYVFDAGSEWVLRLLALPYADDPDYRDEWRP